MTSGVIEYPTAPPSRLRHSPLAAASFVISLLVPAMLILQPAGNFLIDGRPETDSLNVQLAAAWPLFVVATYVLFPVGLIAGAVAAMRRGHKRRLAIIACVINLAVLALLLGWIVNG